MKNKSMASLSRIFSFIAAAALVVSLFVPLWRIELDAPQYPEGLVLQIFPHKIGGDVEIINGLNHYIGMQTLHEENFIEFTILPYIIGFFALLVLVTAIAGKRKLLNFTFIAFLIFGIVSMIDFWRWEYDYGHNLDPNAAIVVPGMAYQPPLIGFKQLLNFGAFSIPDIGGWMFVLAGVLLLLGVVYEAGFIKKWRHTAVVPLLVICMSVFLSSCQASEPEPIKLHVDRCDFCKMNISNAAFAAEAITNKGRVYKFDDVACLSNYVKEQGEKNIHSLWVSSFTPPHDFIDVSKAFFLKSEELRSPMGGNLAAFVSQEDAAQQQASMDGNLATWEEILKK